MKPYILGFLCSCFVVSQTVYTVFGRGDLGELLPAAPSLVWVFGRGDLGELLPAAPSLVWVFVAPLAISYSPLDDHSLRRSIVSCGAAGLCFTALVAGAAFAAETSVGFEPERRAFVAAVVGAAVVAVPLSVGLITAVDGASRALLGGK
jgi:hypothetical protein